MQEISTMTDGKYFRATDNRSLQKVFEEIDQLEKSKIEVATLQRISEEFLPFALASLILLGLDFMLRFTLLKSIP
jgi:Ca-activated chloride channel family protein